jgi:hypothetical protein
LEESTVLFLLIFVLQTTNHMPVWKWATSLRSHQSLGNTIFYLIKIEPRSKTYLLKPWGFQFGHFDQIFALKQSYKWQGSRGTSLTFSQKNLFLTSDRKEWEKLYKW